MKFGLQTYTIRSHQKRDIEGAYLPLLDIGITELEIARIDFNRKNAIKVKELREHYGFNPVSIQVKPKDVFNNVSRIAEFCEITGTQNVVISMLPFSCILGSEKTFYTFIDSLDKQFDVYRDLGLTLAYHHHNWEYVRLSNGKTRMEELILGTEKIRFVTDTYWSARSGVEPACQIEAFGDRLLGVHLRDLAFERCFLDVIPHDTVIGEGVIDFGRVLSAINKTACEYAVIEQKTRTPYEDIKKSLLHLLKTEAEIKE